MGDYSSLLAFQQDNAVPLISEAMLSGMEAAATSDYSVISPGPTITPDYSTGYGAPSSSPNDAGAAAVPWYAGIITTVATAAARSAFPQPLQPGVQYMLDANGNAVPVGVNHALLGTSSGVVASASANSNMLILLVVGFVLYKLVS